MAKCNFNKASKDTNPLKVMMGDKTFVKQIYYLAHHGTATREWQL